jgi:hypothetical protein
MTSLVLAESSFTSTSSSARYVVGAQPSYYDYYRDEGRMQQYWPTLIDAEDCSNRQDILLQVSPGACQPGIVRSDLLEEQDVPVFCKIDALEVNPLLDIKEINSVSFSGKYPPEIRSVGFHPTRAALRTRDTLLGDPLINDIGYVVVVLRKQENESSMPEFVNVTLNANIRYNSDNAFGVGRTEFLMNSQTDEEWELNKNKYSFLNGKYFLKLEQIDGEKATVSIYDNEKRIGTLNSNLREPSKQFYFPGQYCKAGITAVYSGMEGAENSAMIEFNYNGQWNKMEVYEGSRILNDDCQINSISFDNEVDIGKDKKLQNVKNVEIICYGSNRKLSLSISDKEGVTNVVDSDVWKKLKETDKTPIVEAVDSYVSVVELYPSEKRTDYEGALTYGEQALNDAIKLTEKYGWTTKTYYLMNLSLQKYSDSFYAEFYRTQLEKNGKFDLSKSMDSLEVRGVDVSFRLIDVNILDNSMKTSVDLNVGDQKDPLFYEQTTSTFGNTRIFLEEVIDEDSIRISAICGSREYQINEAPFILSKSETVDICNKQYKVRINKINFQKVARISLEPFVDDSKITTNFTVNIGIEKRAIKLNPEKTAEKILRINESIAKFEKITENLGKVVTTMKAACFATSAVLQIKNFIGGLDGTATARKESMAYYKEDCKMLVGKGTYKTMTQCFSALQTKIDEDIVKRENAIKKVNKMVEGVESGIKEGTGVAGYSIDTEIAKKELYEKIKNEVTGDDKAEFVRLFGTSYNEKDDSGYLRSSAYSYQELRDWYYYNSIGVADSSKTAKQDLDNRITTTQNFLKTHPTTETGILNGGAQSLSGAQVSANVVEISKDASLKECISPSIGSSHAVYTTLNFGNSVNIDNRKVLIVGDKQGEVFVPKGYYENPSSNICPGDLKSDISQVLANNNINTILANGGKIQGNEMRSEDRRVEYFGTGPDKNMPSRVPFDVKNGWYVEVPSASAIAGNDAKSYESSGNPKQFYIANVGEDRIMSANDQKTLVSSGNEKILGLSESQSRELISEARNSLLSAARQKGSPTVNINGAVLNRQLVSHYNSVQCQDFMSIQDCNIMFNICDPVICPTTRCDLGGTFPVADVVQTGVIGSAILCLPNFGLPSEGGVIIPVCLSGISAGLESYLSILKNHRDCLQEAITSGKMTGICDEIYSIYICEFFWRQLGPFIDSIIPRVIQAAYMGSMGTTRGGGEYMTVMDAWDNMESSIEYFTQSYAANSFSAFKIRSVSDIGGEFCKGFSSFKAPKAFEGLLEPESPPQFYAWFSEIPFSDVTVPTTSQYKVFYHIYSGNQQGTTYSVYLKGGSSSYYYQASEVQIASGFVTAGDYKSETIDRTLPQGYKELCVSINGKEECGFKQVTTDFGLDYMNQQVVEKELEKTDIKTETGCVSGEASAGALLNVNPGEIAQEVISPDISSRGIVRICSSVNPGLSTNPSRYKKVGYCGEKSVVCWLDSDSVTEALPLESEKIAEETLEKINARNIKELYEKDALYGEQYNAFVYNLESDIDKLERGALDKEKDSEKKSFAQGLIQKIDTAVGKNLELLVFNHHKAQILYMKAGIKNIVARWVPVTELSVDAGESGGIGRTGVDSGTNVANADVNVEVNDDDYVYNSPFYYKSERGVGVVDFWKNVLVFRIHDVKGYLTSVLISSKAPNGKIESGSYYVYYFDVKQTDYKKVGKADIERGEIFKFRIILDDNDATKKLMGKNYKIFNNQLIYAYAVTTAEPLDEAIDSASNLFSVESIDTETDITTSADTPVTSNSIEQSSTINPATTSTSTEISTSSESSKDESSKVNLLIYYSFLIEAIKYEESGRSGTGIRSFGNSVAETFGFATTYGPYQMSVNNARKLLSELSIPELNKIFSKTNTKEISDSEIKKALNNEEYSKIFVQKLLDSNFKVYSNTIKAFSSYGIFCSSNDLNYIDRGLLEGASYNGGITRTMTAGFQYYLSLAGADFTNVPEIERFDGIIGPKVIQVILDYAKNNAKFTEKELKVFEDAKDKNGNYPLLTFLKDKKLMGQFSNDLKSKKIECIPLLIPYDKSVSKTLKLSDSQNYGTRIANSLFKSFA